MVSRPGPSAQHGLTLIEVLVAMMIGTAGVVQNTWREIVPAGQ
ncbi:MAG TPA: prepilin-type N-terminal cleavage/methylation domain-containing protein [Thermoleophilaceae bacterium]|jgi:prepilin-type N-terminal cleavage/methylation domain-containing protein|nr:prepilin-type N-terminal cleavage/methylation domain-containing protein [Thermoleophilaceae bacterium]